MTAWAILPRGFVPALVSREVPLAAENCFATRLAILHRIEYLSGGERGV